MRHLARALAAAIVLAPLATAAEVDAKAVFMENCAKCHGDDGTASTDLGTKYMAQDFTDPDFKKKFNPEKAKKVITNGVKKTKMKSWKGVLSKEEIDALSKFVMQFPEKKGQ
jgi:mono/diheme cytochrome c family protein